jgi:hypothetical protein
MRVEKNLPCTLLNAHDSKGDILRATGVAALAIDQSGIECTRVDSLVFNFLHTLFFLRRVRHENVRVHDTCLICCSGMPHISFLDEPLMVGHTENLCEIQPLAQGIRHRGYESTTLTVSCFSVSTRWTSFASAFDVEGPLSKGAGAEAGSYSGRLGECSVRNKQQLWAHTIC